MHALFVRVGFDHAKLANFSYKILQIKNKVENHLEKKTLPLAFIVHIHNYENAGHK